MIRSSRASAAAAAKLRAASASRRSKSSEPSDRGQQDTPLPPRYHALFRRWVLSGIPGFGSVMIILYLMIAKPF